jgi:hypothetical protein
MITRGRVALTLYLTVGAWLLFIPAASAYLDPGSMNVIFGALIAAAMGLGMTVKLFWRRITGPFRRNGSESTDEPRDQVDADAP